MQRTSVNPWDWSIPYGFSQAEHLDSPSRLLICAGQTSVDGEGRVQHAGDMEGQLSLALDNLERVLEKAGMNLGHVVRLVIYTTDMEALLPHMGVLGSRLTRFEVAPAQSLLGVTRLAFPDLLVELEATAAA